MNPNRREFEDWEEEKVSMEIEVQRSQVRVNAIQNDIIANREKYKNELEQLEAVLNDKKVLLNSIGRVNSRITFNNEG